jgi:hypothetical protein
MAELQRDESFRSAIKNQKRRLSATKIEKRNSLTAETSEATFYTKKKFFFEFFKGIVSRGFPEPLSLDQFRLFCMYSTYANGFETFFCVVFEKINTLKQSWLAFINCEV